MRTLNRKHAFGNDNTDFAIACLVALAAAACVLQVAERHLQPRGQWTLGPNAVGCKPSGPYRSK